MAIHLRPLLRRIALYLVLPNLAFYLLGREVFINRVYINTDYLLLWAASAYLPRFATSVLYAVLLDLDLILSTESVYHFTTAETIVMARELFDHNPAEFYAISAALLLVVTLALALAWRWGARHPPTSHRAPILIGVAALLMSAASAIRSADALGDSLDVFAQQGLTGSAIVETLLASYELESATRKGGEDRASVIASAAAGLFAKNAPGPPNIVLILVESQGLLKSAADMRANLEPLLGPAILARYEVSTGSVRFFGGTMFGELRALCRIYAPDTTPEHLPRLDRCLPHLLRTRGYDTASYHGYWRWFYSRQDWYPNVGFEHIHFADDLMPDAPDSARCGTLFKGLCDLWIADLIEDELRKRGAGKRFIYWLTLNSHLPVETDLARVSGLDCARTETLRNDAEPCALARIHFRLYARIARMALARGIPPTRFIVVGDHSPPFPGLRERNLYDDERVPYVDLVPRS